MQKIRNNGEIFQLLGAHKKMLILFLALFLGLLICTTSLSMMLGNKNNDIELYPESVLTDTDENGTEYQKPLYDGNIMGCPTLPYDLEVPGEEVSSSDLYYVTEYDGAYYTLMESYDTIEDELNDRFASYFLDSIDIPKAVWTDVISDTGYINGYQAEYHTGYVQITTKMHGYLYYGAAYEIKMKGLPNLLLYVCCDSIDSLQSAKNVLDSMICTLLPYNEESATESEISTEEPQKETSDNEAVGGSATPSDSETARVENGVTVYSRDYTLYVNEAYDDGLYIVFNWVNALDSPVKLVAISPSGQEIEHDADLSEDGEWVFVFDSCEKGTYTLHGEATSTIYVNYYEALDKAAYYANYKGENIETGEPSRDGFHE